MNVHPVGTEQTLAINRYFGAKREVDIGTDTTLNVDVVKKNVSFFPVLSANLNIILGLFHVHFRSLPCYSLVSLYIY